MSVPLHVLILEDAPGDAELMVRELRRAGFAPEWQRVETEAEYLSHLDSALDLILADYSLPQFDAMRALTRLWERGLDIPFIIVTGSIGEEVAVECIKQGAADYLLKDRLARLGPAVVQTLEQRRLRNEKRKADELLKLQSTVLEAAANAIMITDRDGRIAWVNPAFTRLTGYTFQEVWGQNSRILKSGKHDASFYQNLWETILSGQVWSGEVVNRRKDGSLYTEETTITPVLDGRGAVAHFIAVRADITERKQATERLARVNRDLRTISLCNQVLVRAKEEGELLREICGTIVGVGGYRTAWVGLAGEPAACLLRLAAVVGCEPEKVDWHAMDLADSSWDTCPVTLAIRTGAVQVVQNIPGNPPCCPWREEAVRLGIGSSISLPLKDGERSFGVLTIYSALLDAFDAEEVTLLGELANDLAYGIQAIRTRTAHERALAEIESLARFPNENPSPVMRVREDGVILYANPPSEPLLRLWDTAVGDRMSAEWSARIRHALETRAQERIDLSCDDRVYSIIMTPIAGGPYVNLYGRDITKRKQAEEALQARTQQLEAVRHVTEEITRELELSQVLSLIIRRSIEMVGADSGIVRLWDDSQGVLIPHSHVGMAPSRLFHLRPGEGVAGIVAQRRAGMIVNDFQTSSVVSPHIRQDSVVCATLAQPLLYRDRLVGVISIFRQTPERPFNEEDQELLGLFAVQAAIAIENARLYQEIRDHAATLEQRVQERTHELEAANQQLQDASRHKSEFLANMSHEIRTPLNSIIGFAELLREQGIGPLTERQARYLTHIWNGGKHLVQLIGDILDLSKVEAGKFVLQPEPLPVGQTLEDILVIARGLANKKAQEIQVEIAPDLPVLAADPVRFKQILFNLLSNAVKFTPEKGNIRLTARKLGSEKARQLSGLPASQPSSLPAGDLLEIAVTDTGVGIRPEDMPRLFQEFVQLETTQAQRHEGTGLGLALTRRLVELHGGRIWAASEGEGRGSTFTVLLPFAGPGT